MAARFWRAWKARRCLCRWRCLASRRACASMEEKRGYATAEVEEIVAAAPERVAPACRHFGACGGCQYQHADYTAQLDYKQAILRETLERGGVRAPEEIAVLAAEPWAYRNRIRLAFDADGRAGYRGRRSHAVIAIAECPIAAPLLVRAAFVPRSCSGSWRSKLAGARFRSFAMRLKLRCWPASSRMARRRFRSGIF